jgi:hypothetical protein
MNGSKKKAELFLGKDKLIFDTDFNVAQIFAIDLTMVD